MAPTRYENGGVGESFPTHYLLVQTIEIEKRWSANSMIRLLSCQLEKIWKEKNQALTGHPQPEHAPSVDEMGEDVKARF